MTSRDEAFAYPYRLVLQTIQQEPQFVEGPETDRTGTQRDRPLRVLDLGCGVGGGVHYLLEHIDGPLRAIGVTLSPTQVKHARREARRRGFDPARHAFLEADFHDLPVAEPVDVAFAIGAFVHTERPETFFEEAARVLCPRGRLVLIDDFFADPEDHRERHLSATEQAWVETVQAGWHAHGLCSVSAAAEAAEAHDLRLVENEDLTPLLSLNRPRDRFIKWCMVPLRPLLWRWPYFRGLIGGDALQNCLNAGIIEYRHLVFEHEPSGAA